MHAMQVAYVDALRDSDIPHAIGDWLDGIDE